MINFPIQYSQKKKSVFIHEKGGRGREVAYRKSKKHIFQNHLAPKIGGNHLKSSQVNTHQKAKRGPKNLKTDDQCVNVCMLILQMMILMLLRTDPGVVYCSRCCVSCNAPSVDQERRRALIIKGFLAVLMSNIIYYEFAKRCRTVQISIVLFCTVYCTT